MQYATFEIERGRHFGIVARSGRLVATFLPGSRSKIRRTIREAWPKAVETPDLLPRFRRQVDDYFSGKPVEFSVEVDLSCLPSFRRQVLEACRRIRYGRTASYADLARAVGKPGAARAVGGAMASNPLPLVIPCHRVLRSDGTLGGFSSPDGVKEKERLLVIEGAPPATICESRPGLAFARACG
jgi:methylated-DNA-[protein]-cysteine S-methyltransferase